jgi:hypothetical protein
VKLSIVEPSWKKLEVGSEKLEAGTEERKALTPAFDVFIAGS